MLSLNRKPMLPPFGRLALVGLSVNAPLAALFLIYANVRGATSLLAGCALALAVYGMLYWVVARGLDLFSADKAEANSAARGGFSTVGFAAGMIGKYALLGIVLYFAWRIGYLTPGPFVVGFVAAQIGITWTSVRHMKKPAA